MKKFLVMTTWGWVAAVNFDSVKDAKEGVLHFLNHSDVGRVVDVDTESAVFKAVDTFERLIRQGKAVAKEMKWNPTEFLTKPLN